MALYHQIFKNNSKCITNKKAAHPDFFKNLAEGQAPEILYIGCSDSRVPANEITGTDPGEIFVHRNIANMVVHSDMNMLSVLDYAVTILKVKHVIVCGHYGCGGVKAAMNNDQYGLIDNWLRHIKDVYRFHSDELEAITDDNERFKRLVEVNVMEQVFDLSKTSIIQNAWRERNSPYVHGWVYDLETGLIKDLEVTMNSTSEIPPIYHIASKVVKGTK